VVEKSELASFVKALSEFNREFVGLDHLVRGITASD
jgi:hypothetical protein